MKTTAPASSPSNTNVCVSMTEFGAYDLTKPDAPTHISTTEVKSCIVLLIKNINEDKLCTHLAFGHLNFANVAFPGLARDNLSMVLDAFTAKGGTLDDKTSIQLFGGLTNDPNNPKGIIKDTLQSLLVEREVTPPIKTPAGYEIANNEEVLTISTSNKGTYIRHYCVNSGECRFNNAEAQTLMSGKSIGKLLIGAAEGYYNAARQKTGPFYDNLNTLLSKEFTNTPPDQLNTILAMLEQTHPHASHRLKDLGTLTDISHKKIIAPSMPHITCNDLERSIG